MHGEQCTPSPASDFLWRYARELDTLAADLSNLQDVLGEADLHTRGPTFAEQCQSLDELTQRAEALAQIALRLARTEQIGLTCAERLVEGIGLGELVRRLVGGGSLSGPPAGDLELF